jgi:hypothetical protein
LRRENQTRMTHALHPTSCRSSQCTSHACVVTMTEPSNPLAGICLCLQHHPLPQTPILPSSFLIASWCIACLPLALKVRTRREEGDALIHDRLADPEVVIEPLLHAGVFSELIWLYTGTGLALAQDFVVGRYRCKFRYMRMWEWRVVLMYEPGEGGA